MIILIQINNSEDKSEKILPLGILAVGSALKHYGFSVRLININEKEIDQTIDYLVSSRPLFIGLSVMTGKQTQHSTEFSKKIKAKHSDTPILWGGIHPTLLPEQCLAEKYIDLINTGEGEETSVELAQKLTKGEPLGGILGLGYKKNGKIIINPPRPLIEKLDDWPLDFSLLDLSKYVFPQGKYQRVMAYKTSRGCPFNCGFCYNKAFNQNRWRAWSFERVISDIEYLKKKYKIDAIKFYDDNFFVDKTRALKILKKINLPSFLEIRVDMINDNLARELKRYRIFDLLIGVESGSNRILRMINKKITVGQIIKAAKSLAHYGVPANYSTIFGLPTETKEEQEQTIDLLYKIYKIHPQAYFTHAAYVPYPGSPLYDLAMKQGFKPPARTEDWGQIDRFRKDIESPFTKPKRDNRINEIFKMIYFIGKVVEAKKNKAISNAKVSLLDKRGEIFWSAKTSDDGIFFDGGKLHADQAIEAVLIIEAVGFQTKVKTIALTFEERHYEIIKLDKKCSPRNTGQ